MNSEHKLREFTEEVWEYYRQHGRHSLPWRIPESDGSFSAYKITLSEIMLQQTQVGRVIPKYEQFLAQFPDVTTLAAAELGAVLRIWSGLGYNRRARFLWLAAAQVVGEFGGDFPQTSRELVRLPGIGTNTAGAILAYAFNRPAVFVETNIQTVFIHHFFADDTVVADKEVLNLVEQTLDPEHPREWYWALMDYGAFLKQTVGNLSARSAMYARQSRFHGSRRQIRGQVLRLLAESPQTLKELERRIPDARLQGVIADLLKERLIRQRGDQLLL